MRIKKAMITAAGWGTRFLPITKSQPKEMLPLLNKPLIQYSVEEAVACGVDLVIIITAIGKRTIEDYFDHHHELESMLEEKGEIKLLEEVRRSSNMVDIGYIRQKKQLGLGHAVLTSEHLIGNEPFLVLLPDDVFEYREEVLKRMIEVYEKYEGNVVAVKRVSDDETSRYGILDCKEVGDHVYKVVDLIEKPQLGEAPSNLAIMGRYVLMPEIFAALREVSPDRNGDIHLTNALKLLLKKRPLYAWEFKGERYDAGTLLGWLETTLTLALKDPDVGPELAEHLARIVRTAPPERASTTEVLRRKRKN